MIPLDFFGCFLSGKFQQNVVKVSFAFCSTETECCANVTSLCGIQHLTQNHHFPDLKKLGDMLRHMENHLNHFVEWFVREPAVAVLAVLCVCPNLFCEVVDFGTSKSFCRFWNSQAACLKEVG